MGDPFWSVMCSLVGLVHWILERDSSLALYDMWSETAGDVAIGSILPWWTAHMYGRNFFRMGVILWIEASESASNFAAYSLMMVKALATERDFSEIRAFAKKGGREMAPLKCKMVGFTFFAASSSSSVVTALMVSQLGVSTSNTLKIETGLNF